MTTSSASPDGVNRGLTNQDSSNGGAQTVGELRRPADTPERGGSPATSPEHHGPARSLDVLWGLILVQFVIFLLPYAVEWVPWGEIALPSASLLRVLRDVGALELGKPPLDQPVRLLTATALHGGLLHLLGNMVGLFAFGRILGVLLGPRRLVTVYWVSGVCGCLASSGFSLWQGPPGLTIGASGAVFGCGWAAAMALLRHRRRLPAGASATAWRLLAYLVFLLVVATWVGHQAEVQIDHAGHVGGSVAGALLGLLPLSLLFRPRSFSARCEALLGAVALVVTFGVPLLGMARFAPDVQTAYASHRAVSLERLGISVWLPMTWRPDGAGGWAGPVGAGRLVVAGEYPDIRRANSLLAREGFFLGRMGPAGYERVFREDLGDRGLGGILVVLRNESEPESGLLFLRFVDLGTSAFDLMLTLPDTPFDFELGLMILKGLTTP
ncbi:MAG: rhomboid family intramembrane serine protease [Planctomycetota bacterium]